MKTQLYLCMLLFVSITIVSLDLPVGWFIAGNQPDSYEMGIEKGTGLNKGNSATIRSTAERIEGFGTLMQNVNPSIFRGKKIRMSGYMKTNVQIGSAAFWLRVDQAESTKPLSFDNMNDRPILGNTDWTKYEIELDVPDKASNIAFGGLLHGTGQIWMDSINIEITSSSAFPYRQQQYQPTNLNFEK